MDRATERSVRAAADEMTPAPPDGGDRGDASIAMTSTLACRTRGSSVRSSAQMSGALNRTIDAQAAESASRVSVSEATPPARTCGIDSRPRTR